MTPVRILAAVAVAASALVAGGAGAAAKKCPVFPDPAGDASFNMSAAPTPDPALDIVKVRQGVKGRVLTVSVTVGKLGETERSEGAEYIGIFTVENKEISVFGQIGRITEEKSNVFVTKGVRVNGTYVTGTVDAVTTTANAGTSTFDIKVPLSVLSAAAGVKVQGLDAEQLKARARGTYVGVLFPFDEADGGTAAYKLSDCA